jgi:hypothetical protein
VPRSAPIGRSTRFGTSSPGPFSREKYCHNGGLAFAVWSARPLSASEVARTCRWRCRSPAGSETARKNAAPGGAVMPPPSASLSLRKCPTCRQNSQGTVIRALWGQQRTRLPCHLREVLPQRGMVFAVWFGAATPAWMYASPLAGADGGRRGVRGCAKSAAPGRGQ